MHKGDKSLRTQAGGYADKCILAYAHVVKTCWKFFFVFVEEIHTDVSQDGNDSIVAGSKL